MFDATVLDVFIASTNDLAEARQGVEEVVRTWNSRSGERRKIVLRSVRWERDATPELGFSGFQDVINKSSRQGRYSDWNCW